MISFFCPFCKHVLKAADELAGERIACEKCKLEIRVPRPAALPVSSSTAATGSSVRAPWWKRLLKLSAASGS